MLLITTPAVTGQMPPTPTNDRLAPWPTVNPPTQADLGAQEYYQRCMVCHGDRGQGLTDEWRGALAPEDQNCWQSGCHHTRHPPGGFIFPKTVPPVVYTNGLSHYQNALNLFLYLKNSMPYQAPGSLDDKMYWQLTAYLLRANGYYPGSSPLSEENAAMVKLVPQQLAPGHTSTNPLWWLLTTAGIALLGWVLVHVNRSRR